MYVKFEDRYTVTRYPAGETHVALAPGAVTEHCVVEAHCRTAEDLFNLSMAAEIRDDQFFVPHLPFARHDHRRFSGDGYPIPTVQRLLDHADILVADPHSDVTANLWRHIPQSTVVKLYRREYDFGENPIWVIPDAGASKKAHTWLEPNDDRIQCHKNRDRSTGKLSGFSCADSELPDDLADRPVVIVDDICDGGGTFLGLASMLWDRGATEFHLAVTHGLFQPEKFDALVDTFKSIHTFHTPALAELARARYLSVYDWSELYELDRFESRKR